MGWGEVKSSPVGEESEILPGEIFTGGGNLRKSDFDNSNIFQS